MKGRCGFELNAIHTKAYESQNSQRQIFSDTGTFPNNNTDAVQVEHLTGIRFLSRELPKLWWSRRNDCSVEVYTSISVCFTNIPLVGLEIKCSYLQNLLLDDLNGINNNYGKNAAGTVQSQWLHSFSLYDKLNLFCGFSLHFWHIVKNTLLWHFNCELMVLL